MIEVNPFKQRGPLSPENSAQQHNIVSKLEKK